MEVAQRQRRNVGVVDFSIFPHVDHPDLPENTMAEAERWASGLSNPAYAIDDDTAIKVVDGTVEVISQGHWKLFAPSPVASESGQETSRARLGQRSGMTPEGRVPLG